MIDMNKEEIIKTLDKYNFDKSKYIVLSGAAMVLYGIKESTNDIDIAITHDYYNYLVNNYDCKLETVIDNGNIYYIDDIINFGPGYYTDNYSLINGIRVQTIEEILNLKKNLNREKDVKDIELIKQYRSR